jgi:hypothetical protein
MGSNPLSGTNFLGEAFVGDASPIVNFKSLASSEEIGLIKKICSLFESKS